jgi:hypothetical protein
MSRYLSRNTSVRNHGSRQLAIESLEPKQMLAGDVTVSQVGGNLFVRGDDLANQLVITSGETAGSYIIRGLEGTNVMLQGSSTPAPETGLVVTGVRGFVNMNTGDGDDEVTVEDAKFRLGLTIATGAGNDEVVVQSARVGGVLSILTGDGDDSVQVGAAATPEGALAATASAAGVQGGFAIDIVLGDGADSAEIHDASAIGTIAVGGGLGADSIDVSDVRTASLVLRGGDGDSADEIDVARAKAFAAVIGTGAGVDRVGIVDSAFTSLNVALGSGDDELSLQKVRSRITVLAGGEGGGDEYSDAGENATGLRLITGFELPSGVNTPVRNAFPRLANLLSGLMSRLLR